MIQFKNVFVPEKNKMPYATDFANGPAKLLPTNRIVAAWLATGVCLGVYDRII